MLEQPQNDLHIDVGTIRVPKSVHITAKVRLILGHIFVDSEV